MGARDQKLTIGSLTGDKPPVIDPGGIRPGRRGNAPLPPVQSTPMQFKGRDPVINPKARQEAENLFKKPKPQADNGLSDTETARRQEALAKAQEAEKQKEQQESEKVTFPVTTNIPPAERQPEPEPETVAEEAPQEPDIAELQAKEEKPDAAPRKEAAPLARPAKQRAKPKKVKRSSDRRGGGKLTVTAALNSTAADPRQESIASLKRRRSKRNRTADQPREKIMREVVIPETITIKELSIRMSERSVDIIGFLMKQGQMVTANDVLDADTAQLVCEELGHTARRVADSDVEDGLFDVADDGGNELPRAPVITIMGHVDHGKTTLLDMIRKSKVVDGEAGGITQHIGAYQIEKGGRKVTFLDTPGHAAFTEMRQRGAQATDIVVLVVAADDGVQPQTKEALAHAKAAGVPIIVAINKIDMPGADPVRVRTDLLQHEVVVEKMGGETVDVEISAKTGHGIDDLIELLLLQADMLELTANPDRVAEGVVVEARLDKGRGNVATVLVQKGTLRVGDILVAGAEYGRVRALIDDTGAKTEAAVPAQPVEVLGWNGTPRAGDRVIVVESETRAREVTAFRARRETDKRRARGMRGSLEQMMRSQQAAKKKEFVLLVKADVQGSAEAVTGALTALNTDEVSVRIVHSGVGGVTEADVTLAAAADAAIMAFSVRPNPKARRAAEAAGIEIRFYNIIYDLIEDVKKAMSGLLEPEQKETLLGRATILEVFSISKVGKIAGSRVDDGVIRRKGRLRLVRDDIVIHEGAMSALKHHKDEVAEVKSGQECGINLGEYQDIKEGDVLECFEIQEVARSL